MRDQNTFEEALRKKRLISLIHLFLIRRYKCGSVHYVSPTEDNRYQASKMKDQGIFSEVRSDVGDIIVATVNHTRVAELLEPDRAALLRFVKKQA